MHQWCKIAVCGDGYVHVGREDCDDSNEEACLVNCKYDREYQIQEKYADASPEEKEIYEEVFKLKYAKLIKIICTENSIVCELYTEYPRFMA